GVQRRERPAPADQPAAVPAQARAAFGRIEPQCPVLQAVPVHHLPREGTGLLRLHTLRPFLPGTLTPGPDIPAEDAPTPSQMSISALDRRNCLRRRNLSSTFLQS